MWGSSMSLLFLRRPMSICINFLEMSMLRTNMSVLLFKARFCFMKKESLYAFVFLFWKVFKHLFPFVQRDPQVILSYSSRLWIACIGIWFQSLFKRLWEKNSWARRNVEMYASLCSCAVWWTGRWPNLWTRRQAHRQKLFFSSSMIFSKSWGANAIPLFLLGHIASITSLMLTDSDYFLKTSSRMTVVSCLFCKTTR